MNRGSRKNIVLTGFMGTGKTTVGRLLADHLGYRFIDTDVMIERESGQSIPDIFAQHGEARFRQWEREIALALSRQEGVVIATGGGMMVDPANSQALGATGRIFCLTASPAEILRRVLGDEKEIDRPLLAVPDPQARIEQLLTQRAEIYQQFTQIKTTGKSPAELVDIILEQIKPLI